MISMTLRSIPFSLAIVFAALLFCGLDVQGQSAKPVLEYGFDDSKEVGPRSPKYPEQPEDNVAKRFKSAGDAIIVESSEAVEFHSGDSITMEAWVKVGSLGSGAMPYLIGKGRHGKEIDQNYAMRLKVDEYGVRVGFLFSSQGSDNDSAGGAAHQWHRWWSSMVLPNGEWHHVAIVYTFGDGDSLRAYVDGQRTDGTWDMGGKTNRAPVSDASNLVVGTGYLRGGSQTFNGWLDDVRMYREALPEQVLLDRFTFTPPPPAITRKMLTEGEVHVQISERSVPAANKWPDYPEVTESYPATALGFVDWPQKYISTGVRADRANPAHFRAAAMVEIPAGKHRLLLRGRGMSRLFIDEKKVVEIASTRTSGGHNKLALQDTYLDLGPDFRFSPPGNNEKWVEFETSGGSHFVILESMIGGVAGNNRRRPEFGETVAAISLEGSEDWHLLSPGKNKVGYNDKEWAVYEEETREWIDQENSRRRAEKRAEHSDFWTMRRKAAQHWLSAQEAIAVPSLPEGMPAHNAIDHFIGAQIVKVAAETKPVGAGGIDYFEQVKPLLEAKCYDCHQGSKIKGELRLDTREAALAGGEYDGPAVSPGSVDDSSVIWRIRHDAGDDIMPPKGDPLAKEEIALLEKWIEEGASWPQFDVDTFEPNPLTDDLTFLRRLAFDSIGVPPSEKEIEQFLSDPEEKRRSLAIDRYLKDVRWADKWMGYWQDVLAENPNIINPTLNNTGPFRWWIHESLVDNKPLDLFVTELVRMEGSERLGGPRGFGTASGNDVPMAAKGVVITSAFLGVEMKCARCHDAPGHEWMQQDLFELAGMLGEKSVKLPMSSSVPMDKLHERARKPLIQVTLKPGTTVAPAWPFEQFVSVEEAAGLVENPDSQRDRLAALITAPANERFAQVMVNRLWHRLMGRGIIETVHDWEKGNASHPELLRWLGRELVAADYDLKEVARIIFESHAYQRATDPTLQKTSPLFVSPAPRRLQAEQIIDSLFSATGKPFEVEEVSLDLDSGRTLNQSITLGKPKRAWMLASTSNERDRPSLSLPRIQAVASIMETFGWRGARQDPISIRDTGENVLQPAILANGTMGVWLTKLSDDHGLTQLALEDQTVEKLVERLYLRLLTREPSQSEKQKYVGFLSEGYENRVIPPQERTVEKPAKREPVRYVSWSNHLDSAANELAVMKEAESREGDPPTNALRPDWRLRMSDVIWAMLNSPEWIYTP